LGTQRNVKVQSASLLKEVAYFRKDALHILVIVNWVRYRKQFVQSSHLKRHSHMPTTQLIIKYELSIYVIEMLLLGYHL